MNALYKSIKQFDKRNRFLLKRNYYRPAMTIYVVRLLNGAPRNSKKPDFMFGCSKPCKNCQKFLYIYNIRKIKYTDVVDGKSVLCEFKMNTHKKHII